MTTKAIIVVDVQRDFCEGGSLAVAGGAEVAAKINRHLSEDRDPIIIFTQDWHIDPGDHFSDNPDFIDSWPVHCKAGTEGAYIHPNLTVVPDANVRKGMYAAAYSGFEGVDPEGNRLLEVLLAFGVREIDVCGLAFDYCVRATALDAALLGFKTRVLTDLTASVHPDKDAALRADMTDQGVECVTALR